MKIVFVTPFFGMSGGIRVVAIYAGLLRQRGHDVMVISQPPHQPGLRQRIGSFLLGGKHSEQISGSVYLEGFDVEHKVIGCMFVRQVHVAESSVRWSCGWGPRRSRSTGMSPSALTL